MHINTFYIILHIKSVAKISQDHVASVIMQTDKAVLF